MSIVQILILVNGQQYVELVYTLRYNLQEQEKPQEKHQKLCILHPFGNHLHCKHSNPQGTK